MVRINKTTERGIELVLYIPWRTVIYEAFFFAFFRILIFFLRNRVALKMSISNEITEKEVNERS